MILAAICILLVQVHAAEERGHVEPVPEVTSNQTLAIHWVGQNLYHERDFIVFTGPSQGCPKDGGPIGNVYCGSFQLHPHWPHAAEMIYGCWHWLRNNTAARWATFNRYPNLDSRWYQHLEILNITHVPPFRQQLGCNDLIIRMDLRRRKSGWHHQEGGANFISVEDAYSYRDWVLRSLTRSGRAARMGCKHSNVRAPNGTSSLQIGILNRRGSRRILNPELIQQAFTQHMPNSQVHTLDDAADLPNVHDQLLWVNRMDIIVAGHGAQLVNLVAAAPCTVVVELFAPQYFIPGFFGPMANALGLKVFGMYMGKDGYADTDPCYHDEEKCAKEARTRQITVPKEFLNFPPVLVKAREKCCAMTSCWAASSNPITNQTM